MYYANDYRDQSRPGNMSSYLTSSWKPAGLTAARFIMIVMIMVMMTMMMMFKMKWRRRRRGMI